MSPGQQLKRTSGSSRIVLWRVFARIVVPMYFSWPRVHAAADFILFKDARGDQCDVCTRTLDAIDLVNPRCLVNKTHKVVARTSTHMYVSLNKLQDWTEEWIKRSYTAGKWSPNSVINADGELVDARLKSGLHPSPVTRDLAWGVPVPLLDGEDTYGMKGKVLCKPVRSGSLRFLLTNSFQMSG